MAGSWKMIGALLEIILTLPTACHAPLVIRPDKVSGSVTSTMDLKKARTQSRSP